MKVHHFLYSAICILLMVISCQKEPEVVKVESLSLNSTSMTIVEGDTQSLMATVSPSTATNKKVIWSSSNSSVATVDDRGTVTAVAPGTATITAKSDDGGKTATCSVTVNSKVISVESVSLDRTSAEITEGETITLTATVKPDNATNKKVTWSSSNEEIATVKDGVVSAVKEGEAIITAKTEDGGKTASCSVVVKEKVYPVESIELDKTTAEITEGETLTLTATIKPENATNKNVIWSSSNEEIATVEDGVVTAIKEGEATITVKTEDGEKTATCAVKVNAKVYPVESISLDKTSVELTESETTTITATVKPDNASNKKVIWSSSNEEVATIKDGVVTAIKAGEATITAKTEDGGKTATCSVKVKAKVYPVESISLDKTSASLKVGETTTLTATIKPDNASNKKVIWSSSNGEIATVTDGVVTAIKEGEATITAKTEDGGKTATCAVTVTSKVYPVESITLDKSSVELTEGETTTLTATIKPDNATNKKVIWSSSNSSVATVDEGGTITAIASGSASITAKTEDGGKTATCSVKVNAQAHPVESVELNKTSASLKVGETTTLTATVKPDNASDKTVTWSSSDASVASVENGVVTAKKIGTATITAKAGGKTATCSITVEATPVSSIELDKTSASLKVGETITLTAIVKPSNATNKKVIWSSSNEEIATVENGVVTALKEGEAIITAKTEDGGKTATCTISSTSQPQTEQTTEEELF